MKKYIFMRFPGGKPKAFTLSYDDGVVEDVRFIETCDKYGLKATFNLNADLYAPDENTLSFGTHRRLTKAAASELYNKNGHEVATHGFTHPWLEKLSSANVVHEILKDREALEEQFGTIVNGHAYPYGTYSDTVVECLKNCGIVYARTVRSTYSFEIPTDWLRLHPTCHHNDARSIELSKSFVSLKTEAPKLFYMWGHTYEFTDNNNWEHFEAIAEIISGKDDVWYASNISIYNYVEAYRSLVFSADMTKVYNPSALDIWFVCNSKEYMVKSGETIKIDQ